MRVGTNESGIIERVAAVDVARAEVVCCARVPGPGRQRMQEVRTVSTVTAALLELGDRLAELGVTRVVMEATRGYWPAPRYLLEDRFGTWPVNAHDVKHLPGRPTTDRLDAVWLCTVAEHDVPAELLGVALGHDDHPAGGTSGHHSSDVTCSGSSPVRPRLDGTSGRSDAADNGSTPRRSFMPIHAPADWFTPEDARAAGRELRTKVAHSEHGSFALRAGRPSVEQFLHSRNAHRLPDLLPLAHGRMAASAFGFFRGSAGLMAHDLAGAPVTGVDAQLCGDAHVANFGLYGTSDGRIVMDINDFDETVVGPWEWDLKRLAASLVLAGRAGVQLSDKAGRRAARHTARSYRQTMEHLAGLPFMDSWTALNDESTIAEARADALSDDFAVAAKKARVNTSERAAERSAHRTDDDWHFRSEPPMLTPVDDSTRASVIDALTEYAGTLQESHGHLLARYEARDVAMRVVGTGSVGLRSYVVLLQGNGGEALILQVKQAQPSALAPYLADAPAQHEGARVVHGARLVQADSDMLLGWTTVDATPFVVRQFRNRKGTIDATLLKKNHLDDYGRLAGALLARAHSKSIDPRLLAGYLEEGTEFDDAIAAYSIAYADQAEGDHAELLSLIASGRVPASQEAAG